MIHVPTVEVAGMPVESATIAVLDVREDYEWQAGHIVGAVHVPMNSLPTTLHHQPDLFARDQQVIVVCRSGGRSAQVTAWLVQQGYDAHNLSGGMHAWAGAGRPMVSEDGRPPSVA